MATTFANMRTAIQLHTGLGDSGDDTTQVNAYINAAARDVFYAHDWQERFTEGYINTVAPLTDGTFAVSNGGSTVTGTGTAFPTPMVNTRKFAKSYDAPWYYATYVSATSLTLARTYAETAETASTYVLYSDVYDLATTVETICTDGVRLHMGRPNGTLDWIPLSRLDQSEYITSSAGRPRGWALVTDQTVGTRRIRLWPIPDAVYTINYRYKRTYTDMSADGDECLVLEPRRDLVIWKAMEPCAILAGKYDLAAWAAAKYERDLKKAIANERALEPAAIRFRQFDEGDRDGLWLQVPE